MGKFVTFAILFGLHSVAQFLAWASADASGGDQAGIWKVLSFPTFPVLGQFADTWFWPLMVGNSAIWAILGTAVVSAWLKPQKAQAPDT